MSDKSKILLVDDEPGMQRYIKTLLEIDDHHVETASTGEQALDLLQKGMEPNLVLLDSSFYAGHRCGLEMLEGLRKLQPNIKVVMLPSMRERHQEKSSRLSASAQADYITKPSRKRSSTQLLTSVWVQISKIMPVRLKTWVTRPSSSPLARICANCGRRLRWWPTSISRC